MLHRFFLTRRTDAYGVTTSGKVFVQQLLTQLPPAAFHILASLPAKSIKRMRAVAETATVVSKEIVDQKKECLYEGEEVGRDVLSLLGRYLHFSITVVVKIKQSRVCS
jgi:hypothetical protein